VGQQVIELLPDSSNKLLRRWQGPGTVVQVKSPYSYLIKLEQGQRRWLHANKLRPYHRRVNEVVINNCAIIYDTDAHCQLLKQFKMPIVCITLYLVLEWIQLN